MKSARLLALLMLFAAIHVACHEHGTVATSSSQTSGSATQIHFFTLVQNAGSRFSNVNEILSIDGYPTHRPYPKYPPTVFECTHLLLHFDSNEYALWNVKTHSL